MKNIYIDLLKSTSKENIDFLLKQDVAKHVKFNKNGKFKYCYIPFANTDLLKQFLLNLDCNSLYITIPMISRDGKDEKPHLILSKQFLLSKYSSPETISKFLMDQLHIAYNDFEFELDFETFVYLIIKYQKIEFK